MPIEMDGVLYPTVRDLFRDLIVDPMVWWIAARPERQRRRHSVKASDPDWRRFAFREYLHAMGWD